MEEEKKQDLFKFIENLNKSEAETLAREANSVTFKDLLRVLQQTGREIKEKERETTSTNQQKIPYFEYEGYKIPLRFEDIVLSALVFSGNKKILDILKASGIRLFDLDNKLIFPKWEKKSKK